MIEWDTLLTHMSTCRYAHSTGMYNTPTHRIKTDFSVRFATVGVLLLLFFSPSILLCLRRAHLQRYEVVEAGVDN